MMSLTIQAIEFDIFNLIQIANLYHNQIIVLPI